LKPCANRQQFCMLTHLEPWKPIKTNDPQYLH
jgi:hypothetical protein